MLIKVTHIHPEHKSLTTKTGFNLSNLRRKEKQTKKKIKYARQSDMVKKKRKGKKNGIQQYLHGITEFKATIKTTRLLDHFCQVSHEFCFLLGRHL